MAVTQLLDNIRPTLQSAFEKAALGEDLVWDVQWALVPTPAGPEIMYIVYVNCAALHQIGIRLQHQFPVPVNIVDEFIERAVRDNVNILLAERTKRLKMQQNGHANTPGDQPPSGLVMP